MGQYAMRVRIDLHACYLVVGSSYPGHAERSKGGGVNSLIGIVSWVKTVARQVGYWLLVVLLSNRKWNIVRKDKFHGTSSQGIVLTAGPTATYFEISAESI